MKDRNLKKVVYILFSFIGFIILINLGQFNALSYIFGLISVYLSRWCYRG